MSTTLLSARRAALYAVLAFATVGAGQRAQAQSVADDPGIAVVVAAGTGSAPALSAAMVAQIFRRKRQLWDDQSRIVPVNLPAFHPLRRNFSLWVLKRSPEDLRAYWDDRYFHGVLPPMVLASEEAVLRFVADTPGAVGYVSVCNVDKRVAVAAVIANPAGAANCPR